MLPETVPSIPLSPFHTQFLANSRLYLFFMFSNVQTCSSVKFSNLPLFFILNLTSISLHIDNYSKLLAAFCYVPKDIVFKLHLDASFTGPLNLHVFPMVLKKKHAEFGLQGPFGFFIYQTFSFCIMLAQALFKNAQTSQNISKATRYSLKPDNQALMIKNTIT